MRYLTNAEMRESQLRMDRDARAKSAAEDLKRQRVLAIAEAQHAERYSTDPEYRQRFDAQQAVVQANQAMIADQRAKALQERLSQVPLDEAPF